jgi:hypothetical protein
MVAIPMYDEVASLIASLDPAKILSLKPSPTSITRLSLLLEKNRQETLNNDEKYELDRMLALEHLISLAKAHARVKMAS